ncbi:MAG: hypothetical protein AB2A00_09520 [Myxococcota bacterium]
MTRVGQSPVQPPRTTQNTSTVNEVSTAQPGAGASAQVGVAAGAEAEPVRERVDAQTQGGARARARASGDELQARLQAQVGGSLGTGASATGERAGVGDVRAATAGMTEAQKYDYYRNLIEQNGGRVNDAPGARNMLAVRNETSTRANGGRGAYDDHFAMIWRDAQGNPHVREYRGNTEPSAQYEGRYGEDANRDGRRDLGRLRPGFYEFSGNGQFLGRQSLRMRGDPLVDRDTNHDGRFNDGATTRGGNSMLIHRGGEDGNPRGTWSAGCQTMPTSEYDRFWRDLTDNGRRRPQLGYTLVNA